MKNDVTKLRNFRLFKIALMFHQLIRLDNFCDELKLTKISTTDETFKSSPVGIIL